MLCFLYSLWGRSTSLRRTIGRCLVQDCEAETADAHVAFVVRHDVRLRQCYREMAQLYQALLARTSVMSPCMTC
jgi:hypothetical protein